MTRVEKKIIDFIEKHRVIIFLGIITLIALAIRFVLLKYESGDYNIFLNKWFEYLKINGGLKALKNYPGDYNAPYMTILAILSYIPIRDIYLIKAVSIFFDIVMAISAALLVKELVGKEKKWISYFTYLVVLFLPQVILNGACWGQCDSIYTSFCLLALYFLVKEKLVSSFICLGLAFSFKLQFVFILPLFIVLYFSKKNFSVLHFLIIPTVNFILCIPALIAGKPLVECFMVYFKQTGTYKEILQVNFINIYRIIGSYADYVRPAGLIFTVALCAIVLFYIIEKKVKWNSEKIITFALWFLIVVTFILPTMHERYLFFGEVLSVIYYICYRKNGLIVAIININAILTYSVYLFGFSFIGFEIMTILYLLLIMQFSKNTFELLESDSKK